ncbi:hypothetical protein Psi02_56410 [Planotetraspora silvatica]|uniref:Uncharacterized protein n=1 Tax=Planotetraspora silvatica TaxID=234614 RepID=A0A8J3UQ54_9ACTN|nr:hypothetical protein Psi02_56410 [Planotetraspora silvatica]
MSLLLGALMVLAVLMAVQMVVLVWILVLVLVVGSRRRLTEPAQPAPRHEISSGTGQGPGGRRWICSSGRPAPCPFEGPGPAPWS